MKVTLPSTRMRVRSSYFTIFEGIGRVVWLLESFTDVYAWEVLHVDNVLRRFEGSDDDATTCPLMGWRSLPSLK